MNVCDTVVDYSENIRTRRPWMGALGVAIAVALTGLPVDAPEAAIRNPEDVMIVDCLLPGQVRKLGRVSTYMTARRPIRTSQADCEIRGGEFVSYDRADYRTALEVWMSQAQAGDAEAQNYVGEIYSKGLGREPDYAKAAEWFAKAVAQGNKRSMINLGYLYEEGLGVQKDLPKALNLYRQASGSTDDDLVFESTVTVNEEAQAEIETLRATVDTQKEETEQLRERVQNLEQQLSDRKRALQQSRSELENARAEVVAKQTAMDPQGSAELDAMRQQVDADEKALAQERATL
ncbi:MAG: peptidase C14, partial [Planctomycetota bacterium]